ncbi:MAG: hypothetical protein MJ082_01010 [Clostridia bacterium]|nr:hypothetical protein [Clostridia bacterium]
MIHPTIEELTKGKLNRYELVVGVAKCARIVTDEYINIRTRAQRLIDNHETDKTLVSLIPAEYRDEKAVALAIGKLSSGRFELKSAREN